jgi:hypothetical protein
VDANKQIITYVYGHADEHDAESASVVRPFCQQEARP